MLYIIFIVIVGIMGGYFAFRYFSILYAFQKITKEISDIQQDLTQNQLLHLPIPDRHLRKLLSSFNTVLEAIQTERQKYEKREKEFQRQIESVSHDLRTPLTVILGYLKLMKKSAPSSVQTDQELAETINIIEQKAEIMKNLVTQFYDFSRLNAGDYDLALSHVDASRLLRESRMGNYQLLEQARLRLEIGIPDCPIWVLGEASALERIFLNLFQNAGRYAATFLSISIKECNEYISISFINDTALLTEDDIPHLFDRFYMQDSSRNQGGTGLGLTVAKSLAEEMRGGLNASILDQAAANPKAETIKVCFELRLKAMGS